MVLTCLMSIYFHTEPVKQRNLFDRPPTRSGASKSETSEKEELPQPKAKPGLSISLKPY